MNLTEVLVTIGIIGIALAIILSPGQYWPRARLDALKLASYARDCAVLSFANPSCQVKVKDTQITLSCSSGFSSQEKFHTIPQPSDAEFSCEEGAILQPQKISFGHFKVTISRRSVEISLEKEEQK